MWPMSETEDNQPEELVVIAYFPNSAKAGMACELLVNNGVNASLVGANFSGLEPLSLPGGYSEIRLVAPASESERAKELYEAFFTSVKDRLKENQEVPGVPGGDDE